jgi:coenzyme F420-reducing hydrogenase gamma subunit
MKYLGIDQKKPKVAVFDFTSCEGCQLQLVNKEETLADFLAAVDVVNFREASSAKSDEYDVAFIEGAVSRNDEVKRLTAIREKAKVVVALGTCACFGGINKLKNEFDIIEINQEVYGKDAKETLWVRSVSDVIPVDLEIPGCPVSKSEVEAIVRHVIWDIPFSFPVYPVCVECKQRFTSCVMEKGQLCLGPITRGGCNAPCSVGGTGCWGCRGPATDPNYDSFFAITAEKGFTMAEVEERMAFYSAFKEVQVR